MLKKLYIFRLNELDAAQKFRFTGTFFVAVFLMIIFPIIKKYQGMYFTTQLITILIIINQLSNKFLEPFNERFRIGTIFRILIFMQLIEILTLSLSFYNFELMIYIYSFIDMILAFFALSYGIKLTSLQAKKDSKQVKKIQIFKQNIWAEGFIIGLTLSFLLQYIGTNYVILVAILIRLSITIYFLKNWNFFDIYFDSEERKKE